MQSTDIIMVRHNPYFNRWFSAIYHLCICNILIVFVTILILIDGFLQSKKYMASIPFVDGHNPYFNRWFSAIQTIKGDIMAIKQSQSLF